MSGYLLSFLCRIGNFLGAVRTCQLHHTADLATLDFHRTGRVTRSIRTLFAKCMEPEIRKFIEQSVLCWLATSTPTGEPNVSPKEVFTSYGENHIIIANIASPNTVKNIELNKSVCISFIDVFVQKGYQIKGKAEIVRNDSVEYYKMEELLLKITGGKFPFKSITQIEIEQAKPIIAPKYRLDPKTTEEQQIESALATYGVTKKST